MSQFKNDGSFLEQFLAKQQEGNPGAAAAAYGAAAVDPQAQAAYMQAYGMQYGYPPGYNPYAAYPMMGYGAPPAPRPEEVPTKSLWVGNISSDVTEADIRREFSRYGMIEHIKLLLHKSCCFVNYTDVDSAIAAHTNSRGIMINGNSIKVGYGKPNVSNEEKQEKHEPCKNLWVGNLSDRITEEDLRMEFEPYGRIERVKLLAHKSCAFVNFSSIPEATRAKNALSGRMLFDRPIKINYGKDEHGGSKNHQKVAPPFAYPPSDEKLHSIISQVATMIVKRGLDMDMFSGFVELQNQGKENPKLSFLLGGEGNEYLRWKTHCVQKNITDLYYPTPGDKRKNNLSLTPSDRKELSDILQALTGTRESIKSATNWISQHSYFIPDVVSMIDIEINSNIEYEKKLYIFYVVNDVLTYCAKFRGDAQDIDPICYAFQDKMVSILRAVYADENEERKTRISQILQLWATKGLYDQNTIDKFDSQMKSDEPIESIQDEEDDIPPWLQEQNFGY